MSVSKIALAIPLALGIACSTSHTQSKDHTGAMWTEHGDGSPEANAQPQGSGGSQADGSASSMGTGSASSSSDASAAADGAAVALAAGGSSDTGTMGPGGSSETGTANPSGSSGTDQGSTATGSSGQGTGTGTAAGAMSGELVKGKVTKVSSSEISITPKGGTAKTLKMGDDTHVMISGKEAKPSQLKKGQWVQANYDADMMATKIIVSSSKQGHKSSSGSHHGTGTSGPSGSSGAPGTGGSAEPDSPGGQ